jgi:chromosome segregation ATPase
MKTPHVPPAPEEISPEQRLQLLNQTITRLRHQLKKEREPDAPTTEELSAQLETTRRQLERLHQQIKDAKAMSKRRKREIDEWKLWFNGLEKPDRSDEVRQLQSEIEWRAQDIARQEARISELNQQALSVEGEAEQIQLRLAAREEGLYKLPLEEDPRFKMAVEARNTLKQQLHS